MTVTAGNTSATFMAPVAPVSATTSVTITASYGGVIRTAILTVYAPTLSSLSLNPTSVRGGQTSQGTITLTGPAPAGGVVVTLSSNRSSATVPASVTVAANQESATFTVNTTPVVITTTVTITARYGSTTKTATLTVRRY